ncbi:glycosyltransferase family 9 protein [uncultured Microbacterium sp.]|uniref:glycosyltransferase family 9 protein n=1 Tax=uncultured Microbacterium sp. TaxID=191216 RepID=UPI0028D5B402|nr:glycosyltransferase family 9 protein [uncultured Microbacterium sp.]
MNLHGSGPESRRLIDALDARLAMVHRVAEIDGHLPRDSRMPEWDDDLGERARWVRLVGAYDVPGDADEVRLSSSPRRTEIVGATVVHVGAFYGSRRWPADRFAEVAQRLAASGHRVIFTGSADERGRALEVADLAGFAHDTVWAGRLDLAEFAALIEDARVIVSADTGAAHLASAYARPSVVLFGPAAPEHWGPPPGPHAVLTDAARRRGDAFAADPDPALLAVTPADVLAAVAVVSRLPAD